MIKIKALNILLWEKRLFVLIDIQKSPMLGSLRHPIDKAGSTSLFNSEDVFFSVNLSAKN